MEITTIEKSADSMMQIIKARISTYQIDASDAERREVYVTNLPSCLEERYSSQPKFNIISIYKILYNNQLYS
jgi:hypothetical protein